MPTRDSDCEGTQPMLVFETIACLLPMLVQAGYSSSYLTKDDALVVDPELMWSVENMYI
jgi:hypothetical protein